MAKTLKKSMKKSMKKPHRKISRQKRRTQKHRGQNKYAKVLKAKLNKLNKLKAKLYGGDEVPPSGSEESSSGSEEPSSAADAETHNIQDDQKEHTGAVWQNTILILGFLIKAIDEGNIEFANDTNNIELWENTVDMLEYSGTGLWKKPYTIKDVESNIELMQGQTLELLKIIIGEEAAAAAEAAAAEEPPI